MLVGVVLDHLALGVADVPLAADDFRRELARRGFLPLRRPPYRSPGRNAYCRFEAPSSFLSTANSVRAPWTARPEILEYAPTAAGTIVHRSLYLPLFAHLRPAPWAVLHERHQRTAARRVGTRGGVAFVGIRPVRTRPLRRSIFVRAVQPIQLHAAPALATAGREAGFALERLRLISAPGARDHALRYRSAALSALKACFQQLAVVPPEFLVAHQTPLAGPVRVCRCE